MRLALILPDRRLWRWHGRLLAALRSGHAVDVFLAPSSTYPHTVETLLSLEGLAFGPRGDAVRLTSRAICPDARPLSAARLADYDRVVALADDAESGQAAALRLRYDGLKDERFLIGRLLRRECPLLTVEAPDGRVLAASYAAVEVKEELGRALSYVFARLISLMLRAVDRSGAGGEDRQELGEALARAVAPFNNASLVAFAARQAASKLGSLVNSDGRADCWAPALRPRQAVERLPGLEGFRRIETPRGTLMADPCLFEHAGVVHLFCEQAPLPSGKGSIVCATASRDGAVGSFETVLERPYHLSYPSVFELEGEVFMLPETAGAGRVELYRAAAFPAHWVLDTVLIENVTLVDPTLLQRSDGWWLFGAVSSFGGSTHDELYAYRSPSLRGPWTPHPANPLKSDVRSSRPAGRFIERGGRLYRPAQDCETGYGAGLVWCEVLELTETLYRERVVARWTGRDLEAAGVHTFSEGGDIEAIDLKQTAGSAPRGQTA